MIVVLLAMRVIGRLEWRSGPHVFGRRVGRIEFHFGFAEDIVEEHCWHVVMRVAVVVRMAVLVVSVRTVVVTVVVRCLVEERVGGECE